MSGPKVGHYEVVSAEELARRRLAAAQDRYNRATAEVATLRARVKAAQSTYGDLAVSLPPVERVRSDQAEDWEAAAHQLEIAVSQCQSAAEQSISKARVRYFAAVASTVTAYLADAPAPRRSEITATETTAADQSRHEDIARVLGRLPGEAPASVVERCTELAQQCRTAQRPDQRERLLAALRLSVQHETDRARLVGANRARLRELYAQLDGLRGQDVEAARGMLKGVALDAPLPNDLTARVAAARDAAQAALDREFVLAAAADALMELGYSVGEDFVTAVPNSGALVDLPHSARHGVVIRERNHQLLFNVARYDDGGIRDVIEDTDAETSFCQDFAALRATLGEQGVALEMLRADAPGGTPVQVVRDRQPTTRQQQAALPRDRDRGL
ncbi:MAG TPA: hypothetical protein VGR26_09430 [Acidimicrobiales bacterium]|nr:hypothetical protein [Acidimicrobiales bacterium]